MANYLQTVATEGGVMVDQPASIKEINNIRILNLLRLYPGMSRIDIVNQTGLGKGTISDLVSELMQEGLIKEVGTGVQLASAGRPPIKLQLNANIRLAIGIELTGTHCVAVLTDLYSNPLQIKRYEMTDLSVGGTLDLMARAVDELMADHPVSKLLGIGIGVPAIVDETRQSIIQSERVGWSGVPLGQMFTERTGKPTTVVKRQAAGALGEYWYGIGHNHQNLVYVSVGIGIGCGILLQGRLYEGSDGYAGEIGHVIVTDNGQGLECKCGNRGCLETVASLPAIAAQARARIEGGQRSSLAASETADSSDITGHAVIRAASQGDALSIQVIQGAARNLGKVLATMVSVFDPSLIIIGGSIAELGNLFLEPVLETIQRRAYPKSSQAVEVVPSSLEHRAAAIGAATLVVDRFFTLAVTPPP